MSVKYFVMRYGKEHKKVAEFLTEQEAEKYITTKYPKDLMGDVYLFYHEGLDHYQGKIMSIITDMFENVLRNPNITDADKVIVLEAKRLAEAKLANGETPQKIMMEMLDTLKKELNRRTSLN